MRPGYTNRTGTGTGAQVRSLTCADAGARSKCRDTKRDRLKEGKAVRFEREKGQHHSISFQQRVLGELELSLFFWVTACHPVRVSTSCRTPPSRAHKTISTSVGYLGGSHTALADRVTFKSAGSTFFLSFFAPYGLACLDSCRIASDREFKIENGYAIESCEW
jgi:hypothetical protein